MFTKFSVLALIAQAKYLSQAPACGCTSLAGNGGADAYTAPAPAAAAYVAQQAPRECHLAGLGQPALQNIEALLPDYQGSPIGTLTASAGGSSTEIGSSNYVVPDKKSVTDQVKVSESAANSNCKQQSCSKSNRHFSVEGGIEINQIGNIKTKTSNASQKNTEAQAQWKNRELVGCGAAQADIPCTSACRTTEGGAPSCGCTSAY